MTCAFFARDTHLWITLANTTPKKILTSLDLELLSTESILDNVAFPGAPLLTILINGATRVHGRRNGDRRPARSLRGSFAKIERFVVLPSSEWV